MKSKHFHNHYRLLFGKGLGLFDKYRLHTRPRYTPYQMRFFGKQVKVLDARSFLGMYIEIYLDEHYRFQANTETPVIIDCGANIALASIYFKQHYPKAKILAFEADTDICQYAQFNLDAFGLADVDLQAKAVWTHNNGISFVQEGGTSGRIGEEGENKIEVPSVRLRDLLLATPKVDFLKMDIEGAEMEVLKDCAGAFGSVEHMFIEYHSIETETQELGNLLNLLTQEGFRYHIKEAFTTAYPYLERQTQTGMDLQLNIFAYRV